MTGLETILSQIAGDAQQEADELLSAARGKAEEILAGAKEEASRQAQAVIRDGEKKAQDIRDRAASAAQLEKRNQMLVFKQQLIRDVIDSARASLEDAPAEEYFRVLLKLVSRFAQSGKGEMRLNARDLARLPAGFEAEVKKAAPQADLTISQTACGIESGFLLVYGGIDINCTFRAIFEDAYDELRDAAGRLLFPGA